MDSNIIKMRINQVAKLTVSMEVRKGTILEISFFLFQNQFLRLGN